MITLSEKEELFAYLTRADPQGEAYRRWVVHTIRFTTNSTGASIFSAVVMAALYKCKYGLPRGHTSYSVWFHTTATTFTSFGH